MSEVLTLNVFLYDKKIGTLTLFPSEQVVFAFDSAYIEESNRPTLSLSFKDNFGKLITEIKPTKIKASPFFSNLLPEGHLREYLAKLAGVHPERDFFLLWALGYDLPGAITIHPSHDKVWSTHRKNDVLHPLGKEALRFSLAGVQLKFSAFQESTGGLTIPTKGVGGSWIVKLPSAHFKKVPENEYSMMTLARHMGMDIPECKLIPLEKVANLPHNIETSSALAFAIKRFDRLPDGKKIHIEDFAQIFNLYPREKYNRANYKNIAEVIWQETGETGIVEFIRRLVFNTLIGNADMHLKNWSLIYPNKIQAALAPAYDFVSTIVYIEDEGMALNYVKSKRMDSLSLETLSYFAAKAGLPEGLILQTAKETVESFKISWSKEIKHLPLSKKMQEIISNNAEHIPLYKEI